MSSSAFVTLAGFLTGKTESLGSCISGHSPNLDKLIYLYLFTF